jgi:hypothetical protein
MAIVDAKLPLRNLEGLNRLIEGLQQMYAAVCCKVGRGPETGAGAGGAAGGWEAWVLLPWASSETPSHPPDAAPPHPTSLPPLLHPHTNSSTHTQ